ncbi:hypothetical protein ACU4GD_33400 [Cupriavidus basilensis]
MAIYKHSAYIATHADMPGFSKPTRHGWRRYCSDTPASWASCRGSGKFLDWRMLFSLRLAFVLCRRRADEPLPEITVGQRSDGLDEGFEVRLPKAWIEANPLVEYSLAQEADEWERIGKRY